jgi:pyridoxamine 5'-phosphate oxidase
MALDPHTLDPDPMRQLAAWLTDAAAAGDALPEAFALATADRDGAPSVRMVLLRGLDLAGLRFHTNHDSRKAADLAGNPRAAAAFWWPVASRQARASGSVERLSDAESDAYWATRPRGSQLSAWVSAQGQELDARASLEARVSELARRFPDEVPRPPFWGGYLLRPELIEFWQQRDDRLHDRVEYRRDGDGAWRRRLLQP